MTDRALPSDGPADGIVDAADGDAFSPPENGLERLLRWTCEAIIVLLIVQIGAELTLRGLFGVSMQFSNEIGGYALIAVTFLSLSSCLVNHAYRRVHLVEARLRPRGAALLRLVFDLLALAVTVILLWQFVRFELITWRSGDVAPTQLMTPLWIPRLVMAVGVAGLALSFLRVIRGDLRRLAAARTV